MSTTVWIINQYASTPTTGLGGRHYYMAKEMAKLGHKVYVIGSASHHLLQKKPDFEGHFLLEEIEAFNFVWVKMPDYEDAHSKQRVLNWFIFSWRLKKLLSFAKDKPDTIMCSSPSLLSFLGAQYLAKKLQARLVFEVRDIWPLTLTKIGGFSVKHPFIRLMQWVENMAYRKSDAVISNLKNSVEHMAEKGLSRDKFTWVPNGISFDEVSKIVPLNVCTKAKLPNNKFVVGYTGTMGVANSLELLIEAAFILREYDDIAFVMVGEGKEKNALKFLVESKGLSNITFIDSIAKVEIQSMLAHFDACYIGWRDEPLYQYGIAANKIYDYLYSGKPILHSYSGKCDPVKEAKAGITVPAQDKNKLANAILELYSMPQIERDEMGGNGRNAAISTYEYGKLADKLAGVLFD